MAILGFIINPIAGMGGRVGLKGTDGVAAEAVQRGAEPVANARALAMLQEFKHLLGEILHQPAIKWLTAGGEMGNDALRAAGFDAIEVVHRVSGRSSAFDTKTAVEKFLATGVDLILFCGGDGTARDICTVAGEATPILGTPSGVKMYSGVFGITPAHTAEILLRFLVGDIGLARVEIADLDEERYRRDEWAVRLYLAARTPFEPNYLQSAKALINGKDEEAIKEDSAASLREEIEARPGMLFLLGPGFRGFGPGRSIGMRGLIFAHCSSLNQNKFARMVGPRFAWPTR